jgi:hypothetical protein
MSDEPAELTPEQTAKFMDAIKEPYKEHEQEKRRRLEINAEFFDKLSAVCAGSIAVAASIILAIVLKSDLPYTVTQPILHQILKVVALLWLSLLLAIIHNFLTAIHVQLEAAYSGTDFIVAIMKVSLKAAREQTPIDDATAAKLEDAMNAGMAPKRGRIAKIMNGLYPSVPYVGYASMAAFLAAYTLVAIYLLRLW